jgi:transcriptional regulator with XRE-family HTH domain
VATDTGDRRDTEQPYLAFGKAVREARERQDISRADVADRLGISYPMLANIESGRRRLSDELLEKLAPLLGVESEELRVLRDAGASPSASWAYTGSELKADAQSGLIERPLGASLQETAATAMLRRWLNQAVHSSDPEVAADASLTRMLLEAQEQGVIARADDPFAAPDSRGWSGQMTALLRDLRELDRPSIDKAHAFVKGLLAAQEREATALDPIPNVPLIRVPAEPFGPRQRWSAPVWMRDLPDADDARERARRLRDRSDYLGRHPERNGESTSGRVARHFCEGLLTRGPLTDRDRPSIETMTAAVSVGMALHPRGRTKRGLVDAYAWLTFVEYHPGQPSNLKIHTTLSLWLTRMVFIASVTRGQMSSRIMAFIDECLPFSNELAPKRITPRPPHLGLASGVPESE